LVTIPQEIGGRGLLKEGVDELLSGPGSGGVLGDVEADNAPAVMGEDDKDEEDAEASNGHGKEVDRDQVADMVSEEGPPGLRGVGAVLRHEAGHGALGNGDAELQELAVDSRSTPQGIRRGHFPDEGSDLGIDGRAASGGATGQLSPVLSEASALPAQDSVGRHDDQRVSPARPDSGQADPEQAVGRAELQAGPQSLVDGELLAQGEVLEGELAMTADKEGKEPIGEVGGGSSSWDSSDSGP
jgi:hypothetical protein